MYPEELQEIVMLLFLISAIFLTVFHLAFLLTSSPVLVTETGGYGYMRGAVLHQEDIITDSGENLGKDNTMTHHNAISRGRNPFS